MIVMIALLGLVALIAALRALAAAWRLTGRSAISAVLRDDGPAAEVAERSLTADLLSGAISRERYREAVARLAAAEAQPAELRRLVG